MPYHVFLGAIEEIKGATEHQHPSFGPIAKQLRVSLTIELQSTTALRIFQRILSDAQSDPADMCKCLRRRGFSSVEIVEYDPQGCQFGTVDRQDGVNKLRSLQFDNGETEELEMDDLQLHPKEYERTGRQIFELVHRGHMDKMPNVKGALLQASESCYRAAWKLQSSLSDVLATPSHDNPKSSAEISAADNSYENTKDYIKRTMEQAALDVLDSIFEDKAARYFMIHMGCYYDEPEEEVSTCEQRAALFDEIIARSRKLWRLRRGDELSWEDEFNAFLKEIEEESQKYLENLGEESDELQESSVANPLAVHEARSERRQIQERVLEKFPMSLTGAVKFVQDHMDKHAALYRWLEINCKDEMLQYLNPVSLAEALRGISTADRATIKKIVGEALRRFIGSDSYAVIKKRRHQNRMIGFCNDLYEGVVCNHKTEKACKAMVFRSIMAYR